MPTLQELERPLDEAIVSSLIEATPEQWQAATLEIEWCPKVGGIEGFRHLIASPDGHKEIVQATEQIHELTLKLADLFRQYGKQWRRVVYSIKQEKGGDWKYSAEFFY